MFIERKSFGHPFICLVILLTALILTSGCETAEP